MNEGGDSPETLEPPDWNRFSTQHKKSTVALAWNVQNLAEKWGLEKLGFLTLTFRDKVLDPHEAQRRFNSLKTNVLAKRYPAVIRVWERTKAGRIHYHLLVVLDQDIRTGVDFKAIANGDYRSAGKVLRAEWAYWRKTAPNYGFGRTELLPVKSTAEGIARYVGKYISKHMSARDECDKGFRLVEYSRGARMASTRFAWATEGGKYWRTKLALFSRLVGAMHGREEGIPFGELKNYLCPSWAYKYREFIAELPIVTDAMQGVYRLYDSETGEMVFYRRRGNGALKIVSS